MGYKVTVGTGNIGMTPQLQEEQAWDSRLKLRKSLGSCQGSTLETLGSSKQDKAASTARLQWLHKIDANPSKAELHLRYHVKQKSQQGLVALGCSCRS